MTKNMKKMTALACAAMMIASMGITGCGKADGQTKEETKTTAVETPAGTETSATTENEAKTSGRYRSGKWSGRHGVCE